MRADRLVSLVLLLRQRGKLTADELSAELEVSARTVQRDIDALSLAGVPVYAERGRYGGFALLPGFRTELTGVSHDEALALLSASAAPAGRIFGLSSALASAMRKVVDALPAKHQADLHGAAQRLLIEPETDLLARRTADEELLPAVVSEVRRAVLAGHKLRFHYATPDRQPQSYTVDPIGLVSVRGRTYLLALKDGADRTFRLSRMLSAEASADPANRPDDVDLRQLWTERGDRFLAVDHLCVVLRVRDIGRSALLDRVRSVRRDAVDVPGWSRLEVTFEDMRHALWAVWQLGTDAEVVSPEGLRVALRERAAELVARYQGLVE